MSIQYDATETVLPDDYPIYGDYLYIADGKLYRSNWHDVTVSELKRREGFKEVRRASWKRFDRTGTRCEGGAALAQDQRG